MSGIVTMRKSRARAVGRAVRGAAGWLALLAGLAFLNACGGDETAQDQAPADQPAGTATANPVPSDSDYTSPPSPLLDQPQSSQSSGGRSSADLPPITASIPATMPNRIDVTVHDPLPVSGARLVDPRGVEIVAARIDHDRIAYKGGSTGWPRLGFGISGGSSSGVSTGFGIGFPLFPQTSTAAGSINESRFSFVIPDIGAYDTSWQRWKIHIDLSDGVNTRSFETLPPAPPRN